MFFTFFRYSSSLVTVYMYIYIYTANLLLCQLQSVYKKIRCFHRTLVLLIYCCFIASSYSANVYLIRIFSFGTPSSTMLRIDDMRSSYRPVSLPSRSPLSQCSSHALHKSTTSFSSSHATSIPVNRQETPFSRITFSTQYFICPQIQFYCPARN